jgi:antitoxin (DNA-binding transcriptional repressor) of toxin-antitoxin stability system
MVIVSTRDFRSNQSHYLNLVNKGESVILRSRTGNYRLTPVSDEDVVANRDLTAELRSALLEVKDALAGKKTLQSLDSLIKEL